MNVFDYIRSDENRYISFSAQPCQPPVRFLTAIYNALSLYFKRKNAYGCRLISSTINLSAISHVYRYTSTVFRNSIHFSWSSIQRLSQRFLIFLIFPFVLFVLFIDYNGKLLKNLRSRIENFEKKIRYDIAILENFGFWPGLQKLETQLFKSFRCSLFLILLHSCIHWRIVWRIDRISHWLLLYKEYLIAYFLASFFFLLCLSWHTNDESISIQLKIDYEKTLWKKLNIPRNAKNDTFR